MELKRYAGIRDNPLRQTEQQTVLCARCGYEGRSDEMIVDDRGKIVYYCGDNCYEQAKIEYDGGSSLH